MSRVTYIKTASAPLTLGPCNAQTALTAGLVHALDPEVDLKMNLILNFGGFLAYVPCRLGKNEVLDATVDAFVAAYAHFCTGSMQDDSVVLRKNGVALAALRRGLEDPSTAHSSETLCAVQMMMIYQVHLVQIFNERRI